MRYPHVWLKLIRSGDTITSQCSQDGERWKIYSVHPQQLPHAGYLGLAVTSHKADQTVRAVFSHLRFSLPPAAVAGLPILNTCPLPSISG